MFCHMHTKLLVFGWLLLSVQAAEYGTCPLVSPPLDLGTGSLNQLMDTVLLYILVPESTVEVADPITLAKGVVASDIKVYQLQTIKRTCPIQLQTSDSLGCTERGLLMKACFGASQIRVNLSLVTPYIGIKKGRYILNLPAVTIRTEVKLFSPDVDVNPPTTRLARITSITSTLSKDLTITPIDSSWTKNFASGLVKFIYPLIRSKLIQEMDAYLLQMLNNRLKDYKIKPLFVPDVSETKTTESKTQRRRPVNNIQAVREIPRLMAFPLH
ncbi:hypothetical protein D915_002408 [Fasciola hepatica]|uniref:Lipid-binding serum glycoprotein N-terminal domain-containing protein n=1 Tax=Fasciola hepatica TaxID=6192 RepID=A0A4E0RDE4_FASHE|nr:hypothetical protein D915_002408 [Fasciola hepatica]